MLLRAERMPAMFDTPPARQRCATRFQRALQYARDAAAAAARCHIFAAPRHSAARVRVTGARDKRGQDATHAALMMPRIIGSARQGAPAPLLPAAIRCHAAKGTKGEEAVEEEVRRGSVCGRWKEGECSGGSEASSGVWCRQAGEEVCSSVCRSTNGNPSGEGGMWEEVMECSVPSSSKGHEAVQSQLALPSVGCPVHSQGFVWCVW